MAAAWRLSFPPVAVPSGPRLPPPRPRAGLSDQGRQLEEVEEATAGSEAGRARVRGCGNPPPPAGGGSRGGEAQPRALRLANSEQGAEPTRPVITRTASKASRLSQSALEPWPAHSLPSTGKQGLGNSHLLRLILFHKNHWILHASVTPTSTPCPHDPVPATGKGFCVFFLFSSRLSVCVQGNELAPQSSTLQLRLL